LILLNLRQTIIFLQLKTRLKKFILLWFLLHATLVLLSFTLEYQSNFGKLQLVSVNLDVEVG